MDMTLALGVSAGFNVVLLALVLWILRKQSVLEGEVIVLREFFRGAMERSLPQQLVETTPAHGTRLRP